MNIKKASNRNYVIFHKGPIEMNGKGVAYITDKERDEKMSPDQGFEAIIEDLSGTYPEFYEYQLHLYINADMAGYGMEVDYHQGEVPDEVVDKVSEWLWQNVGFERIEEDTDKKFSKVVKGDIMKINSNTVCLAKEDHAKLEEVIKKIASENKIENVKEIHVSLSKDNGIIKFGILNPEEDIPNIPKEDILKFKELTSRIDAINKKQDEITKERSIKDPKTERDSKIDWVLYTDDSKKEFPYRIELISEDPYALSEMESWFDEFRSLDEVEKKVSLLEKTVKLREVEPNDMINYY